MNQELCDHIDQLDLALDQLALKDRNFDRFALMLIDNVVELILHQHACTEARSLKLRTENDNVYSKMVRDAQGPFFDRKVSLAKHDGLVTEDVAESLNFLHAFRNAAHHQGLRHEGILHPLSVFYFLTCCNLAESYRPTGYYAFLSNLNVSHRAMKYLGSLNQHDPFSLPPAHSSPWARLRAVGQHMGANLLEALATDMSATIDYADSNINFILNNSPSPSTRARVIVEAQVWDLAFSEKGRKFAEGKGYKPTHPLTDVLWFEKEYPSLYRTDPIPMWRERQKSLLTVKDQHKALKNYCSFMDQTKSIRAQIEQRMLDLDAHLEAVFDLIREE